MLTFLPQNKIAYLQKGATCKKYILMLISQHAIHDKYKCFLINIHALISSLYKQQMLLTLTVTLSQFALILSEEIQIHRYA